MGVPTATTTGCGVECRVGPNINAGPCRIIQLATCAWGGGMVRKLHHGPASRYTNALVTAKGPTSLNAYALTGCKQERQLVGMLHVLTGCTQEGQQVRMDMP